MKNKELIKPLKDLAVGDLAEGEPLSNHPCMIAIDKINALTDFVIWMTGCGYDFCQHEYFCKNRDELLK